MKNRIYIIGNFSFPYGNASGSRVLSNGYLFRSLGYEVIFIGLDNSLQSTSKIQDTLQNFDEFQYYNLPYPIGIRGWIDYKKRYQEVISIMDSQKTYAIVNYGSPTISLFSKLLLKWCEKNNVLTIADCVDWLSASTGSFLYRTVKHIDTSYQKRYLNAKADAVITISTFLQKYYKSKNCITLVLPPLVNSKRYEKLFKNIKQERKGKMKLIYVGTPFATDGRKVIKETYKDRLDKVIEILCEIKKRNFIFNIYGITKKEYLSVVKTHNTLIEKNKEDIIFNGSIENDKAIQKISEADFTLLFRDVNRMTISGFPTKFVETISCGTPIITTKTSDLEEYIIDGKNGYIISMDDKKQLESILSTDRETIRKMKFFCINSKQFSYENYIQKMKQFLKSVQVKNNEH